MANEWETVQVGEIADSISITHSRTKDKLVFLNTSDVLLGKVLHQTYTDVCNWPGQAKKSIRLDDILLSEIRPANGRWAYIYFDADDFVVSTKLMVIRAKVDRVFPRFLYHFLTSFQTIGWLQHLAESRSGTFPQITFDQVAELKLSLPPRGDQEAIARFLDCIDGKIDLNCKQSETVEAMARALFKAWFVDFEPVRAKMEGRWQRGQSLPGLPAPLYDLFPERLVESELGEIPEGWEVGSFSDAVEVVGGGTPKTSVSEYWNGDIPWFSVVDTPASSGVFVVQTEKSITQTGLNGSSARMVAKGTTIISARGTVGNLAIAGRDMTFNQSCYALRGKNGSGDYFVFLSAQCMVERLKAMAHGSVFSTITRQTFDAVRVGLPPDNVLQQFERSAASLFDAILGNVNESRSLAQLRDTLLPKLISGELRISDAERIVEDVRP